MKIASDLAKEIDETLLTFACACDWINTNTPLNLTNKTAMQSLVYRDVRSKFGLSSNLAIQAVRRVCANRKTAKQKGKKVKGFSPTSVSAVKDSVVIGVEINAMPITTEAKI